MKWLLIIWLGHHLSGPTNIMLESESQCKQLMQELHEIYNPDGLPSYEGSEWTRITRQVGNVNRSKCIMLP